MSGAAPSSGTKRRFPRYPLDVRVGVNVFRDGETISLWGRSHEIAQDGLGATLTGELAPGEVVSLELNLPLCASPLKLRALVRYSDGLRHGFEFLIQHSTQRESLRKVCELLATGT
jgi:hypothetical protein